MSEKELNETGINNMFGKAIQVMIIKIFSGMKLIVQ